MHFSTFRTAAHVSESFRQFCGWLPQKLSNRQFLILAAVFVGLWAGLTAVLLKVGVHYLQALLARAGTVYNGVYFISPLVGIFAAYLFTRFALKGDLQKGTSHVLLAIAKNSSRIPAKETYSHAVTSAFTVGMGGSAGLESPIVQTGAAVGSVLAGWFPLAYRDRTLLLACGAAAGIASVFNAPIAGVLIAIEVLLVDAGASAFVPLLIAGATGALTSEIILSEDVLFSFKQVNPFNYLNVPFYVLLGISCGLLSVFYKKSLPKADLWFKTHFLSDGARILAGGILLGALMVPFPALFGEGYAAIKSLAVSDPSALFAGSPLLPLFEGLPFFLGFAVLVTGLLKVFAVSITLSSGGNGGNFAPSLLAGSCLGFSFAFLFNASGFYQLPMANFSLVGMAGVLAGIFHAPLSGIFLIAEITGGYDLIIPLMLVTAISTAVSRYLSPLSLDEAKLKAQQSHVQFSKDTYVLSELTIEPLIEKDFVSVKHHAGLKTLLKAVSESKRNIFPVLNDSGELKGIVTLEDIREVMFDTHLYDLLTIDEVMQPVKIAISVDEEVASVMEKFDRSGLWNIPVLKGKHYVGFISKSSVFTHYRSQLQGDDS